MFRITFVALSLGMLTSCGAETEPASIDQLVSEMNQRIETITRSEAVNDIIPRFNQGKSLGCFNAEFKVHENINPELKHGIFSQPATYPARLRFANATQQNDSKKDLRGLSIKLSGIEAAPLYGNPGEQDFLLNSYPALFAATPEDFAKFIKARQNGKVFLYFLNPLDLHLYSLWIVIKAREKINSPFDIRFWSTTPYQLGEKDHHVVKYSVTPCSDYRTKKVVSAGKNQLRAAMKAHLRKNSGCFNFGVQLRTDPDAMPIEDAAVIWDEKVSPFQTVATITFHDQNFASQDSLNHCETMDFNPWQSTAPHRPLGRMNEVRRAVYSRAAHLRGSETP